MTESFEARVAREQAEFFEAMAAEEGRRIAAGDFPLSEEASRRMLARCEAKAAEWRAELERLQRA